MLSTLDKTSAIKIFTVLSSLLLFLNAFTTIFEMLTYTSTIVCLYLSVFTLVIVVMNLSPYVFDEYIVKTLPFLAGPLGRAAVYIIVASFCFGDEFNWFGKINGISMMVCAVLAVYTYAYTPVVPPVNTRTYYDDEI